MGLRASADEKALATGASAFVIAQVAGQCGERGEVRELYGVGAGDGIVAGALEADDDIVRIIGGREVAAAGLIPIVPVENARPLLGVLEIGFGSGRREEAEGRPSHVGVVGCGRRRFGETGTVGVEEPAIVGREFCHDAVEGTFGKREPFRPLEYDGGAGEGRDHQTVPVGEDLVVPSGPDARARRSRSLARMAGEARFFIGG